jgi:hypothetical protein
MGLEVEIFCANPKCFNSFKAKRSWQKYCSVTCRNVAYNNTILVRLKHTVVCPHCNKDIIVRELKEVK